MSLIKFPKPKQDSIPIGSITSWSLSASIPTGWLECNGAAISRSVYVNLFEKIGTTFGSGDGSTTFNIPDLRGEFIRGWDHNKGVDSGRTFGSLQLDELKSHSHVIDGNVDAAAGSSSRSLSALNNGTNNTNSQPSGGTETRPRNVALIFIIKAEEGAESVPGTWAEDHLNAPDPHTQYTTAAELSASIYNHESEYDHTLIGSGGSGGSSLNYNTYTTTGNLSASTYNVVNTSASSFTLTMPVSASFGDQIWIHDLTGTFKTNPLTINNNGIPIRGLNENHILDIDYTVICYTYYDTDIGWIFSYSGTEGSGNPAGIDEGIATNGDCDLETGRIFDITVSGATTISFSNVPSNQAAIALLRITNGGTNVTWPVGILWPSGTAPTLTTTGLDYVTVLIDSSGMISATYDLDMK